VAFELKRRVPNSLDARALRREGGGACGQQKRRFDRQQNRPNRCHFIPALTLIPPGAFLFEESGSFRRLRLKCCRMDEVGDGT
jgi:hypothetical protein